jgi:Flp pilus assembly protein CpaB
MNGKKDILPVLIASGVALVVTGIVRVLIPGGGASSPASSSGAPSANKGAINNISMPDIPLMVKESKKEKEGQVLLVSKDIKSGSKIVIESLAWKKWPQDAIQPYFIAKDTQGTPLNNGADYNNALKMWAAADIPAGVPLTIRMLTNEDPVKKAAEEKKKKEAAAAAAKKKVEEEKKKKKADVFLKPGMRAVTFPIDQKTPISSHMINPGDLVDILIPDQKSGGMRVFKYTAVKILAIDGMTSRVSTPQNNNNNNKGERGLFEGLSNVGGLLTPKNITLEIKESRVEEMLRRVGGGGVMLSLRSQDEKEGMINDGEEDDVEESTATGKEMDSMLHAIARMNQEGSAETLRKKQSQNEDKQKAFSMLLDNLSSAGGASSKDTLMMNREQKQLQAKTTSILMENMNSSDSSSKNALLESKKQKELNEANMTMIMKSINSIEDSGDSVVKVGDKKFVKNNKTGKYEIVSGKIVGEEKEPEEENSVVIYRKLKTDAIQFDASGKKIEVNSDS